MRTVIRFGTLGLLTAAVLGAWWLRSARATDVVAIRPNVEVTGATPEQLAMARWAIRRFEIAGLKPPAADIEFHGDRGGCSGHLGFARTGQVDVCSALVNAMSRRALLHEMSHIWLDQSVDGETRERFLDLRGLPSWNASTDPWELRGYEQAAEIVSWEIGEQILTPQIPYREGEDLDVAFRLLTGAEVRRREGSRMPSRARLIASKGRRRKEPVAVKPIPDQYHSLQPYLLVEGTAGLMEFLKATFGAEDLGSMPTPEGKIGHAEMRIGDTIVMMADASTAEGVSGPMPATVVAYVEDADKVYQRALEAGATSLREPQDMFYGDRSAGVADPFGNHWWIHTHVEDVSDEEMMRRAREQQGS